MLNNGKYVLYRAALLLYLASFAGVVISQPFPTHEVYIRVTGGRNVQLNVNSFARYNNGYTLENWTRLVIDIPESVRAAGQPWSLYAFADSNQLLGDMFGNLLDAGYITLTATRVSGDITPAVGGRLVATERTLKLADGIGHGRFELMISYGIGTEADRRLLGHPADIYFTDVWFQVYAD